MSCSYASPAASRTIWLQIMQRRLADRLAPSRPTEPRFRFMPDPLTARLKALIIQTLRLDDIRPEDIPDDEPLFGSPRFGLDSIDALELVVQVEKEFGVK